VEKTFSKSLSESVAQNEKGSAQNALDTMPADTIVAGGGFDR
jgi:hypothetical protein